MASRVRDLVVVVDPEIVLLDEPTAGMSSEERRRFGGIMALLRDSLNLTVLVAAREPAGLLEVCDFVYVLDAGRVVASGGPAAIRSGPGLARMDRGRILAEGDRGEQQERLVVGYLGAGA